MIKQTIFAVAQSDVRQVLTGSLFENNDGKLRIVSVDGFRLAMKDEEVSQVFKDFKFIVPYKTLSDLLKILKDDESEIEVCVNDNYALLAFENTKIITRLIEGEFLNYNKIIPQNSEIKILIEKSLFLNSVERCLPILGEDVTKYPVKLSINSDDIEIKCVTEKGTVYDNIPVSHDGKEIEIGFNQRYLLDALRACDDNKIVAEFTSEIAPCIIRPGEGDGFLFLVLPVRLRND